MLQTDVDLFVLFYECTFLFLILLLFLNLAGIYPHAQSLYVIFFLQFAFRYYFELTRYIRICSFNEDFYL